MPPDRAPNRSPNESSEAEADARFVEWMRMNLDRGTRHFGLAITGEPVFGWRLRSVGAEATASDGASCWVRVVTEFPEWACGDSWTGNVDAQAVRGISRPRVLDWTEWSEGDWRQVRAEVMDLLPGRVVSGTNDVQRYVALPAAWWADLRRSVDVVGVTPTERMHTDQARVSERTRAAFGIEVRVRQWETVHGDLHWGNLLAPRLGLLDWELWGRGPSGTDAATLFLCSLRVPRLAARVRAVFADMLDSDAGRTAQLIVAARLHARIAGGDFSDLAEPLYRHIRSLGAAPLRSSAT